MVTAQREAAQNHASMLRRPLDGVLQENDLSRAGEHV